MHLLVLSAFRPKTRRKEVKWTSRLNAPSGAQCFPTIVWNRLLFLLSRLNAPSGAQCFPTRLTVKSMCGVLRGLNAPSGAQCFPTSAPTSFVDSLFSSQCTFWCSVLSDLRGDDSRFVLFGLNAPSGAQCFPTQMAMNSYKTSMQSQCTFWCSVLSDSIESIMDGEVKSQCTFWCSVLSDLLTGVTGDGIRSVSMHLLVLSAFRLRPQKTAPQRRLPERNRRRPGKHHIESARTCPIKPHNREKPPQNDPAPPTPPTSQYATGFQRTQAKESPPYDYARVNFVLLGIQNPLLQSDAYFASGITDTGLH